MQTENDNAVFGLSKKTEKQKRFRLSNNLNII